MSKQEKDAELDSALSPYLSVRQALRPAIVAHSVLLREKSRAGALADQANQILTATRELLSKVGLDYITVSEPGVMESATIGLGREVSLLDAFSDAAMLWAKVVASCLFLADAFLEQGQWDQVRTLAAVLADAGEREVAKDLRVRLARGPEERCRKRISAIHVNMNPQEIEDAIEAIITALSEIPQSMQRDSWLISVTPALAVSAWKYAKKSGQPHSQPVTMVRMLSEGSLPLHPQNVGLYISNIAAAFRATAIGRE